MPDKNEIKRVDRLELRAAVVGVFHPVREPVNRDQDRGSALDGGEFAP